MENNLIDLDEIKEDKQEFKKIMLMYDSALKEIETKVNILSAEFQMLYKYNPIEHVKTRLKSPDSIVKKLKSRGFEATFDNLVNELNDVAGIRIVCSFLPDIYRLVEMFDRSPEIKIIEKKDYIKNPKESGYSSYHLIASVPVSFSSGTVNIKVELQIRTIAMDFWASLEHKIKYKYDGALPKNLSKELIETSKLVNKLDRRMSKLGSTLMEEFENDLKFNKKNKKKDKYLIKV